MQAHSSALSSAYPANGVRTRKRKKYKKDATCPIMTNGCVTGIPPIQVRMRTSAIRVQNRNCVSGRKVRLRCLDVCRNGTSIRIRIEARRAKTPPSLLGMDQGE